MMHTDDVSKSEVYLTAMFIGVLLKSYLLVCCWHQGVDDQAQDLAEIRQLGFAS